MIVIDATVAVKLVTLEPGADAALARIVDEADRAAPDWIRIEVANSLARKVKRDGLSEEAARAGRTALDMILTHETRSLDLLDEAFNFSMRLKHAVYDCLYIALAVRGETMVVTHDIEFAAAARRAGFAYHVELMA